MKVLITGCQGQIGRSLREQAAPDLDVVAASHRDLDIANESEVREYVARTRPQVIINAAAYTAVDQAQSDVETCRRVNAHGARMLAEAALEADARLVHVSTDFVFDGASPVAYGTEAPPSPLNVYGETKLAGELAVREVLAQRSLVVRTAWVYAPGGRNFLRTMLRSMREHRRVRVVADQVGTPTAAFSVAQILLAFARRADLSGTFHWTDAGVASWFDFAVAIAEESAAIGLLPGGVEVLPISTSEYPTPAQRPRFSVLDKESTIKALGVTPAHWRVNLRKTLAEIAGE